MPNMHVMSFSNESEKYNIYKGDCLFSFFVCLVFFVSFGGIGYARTHYKYTRSQEA